MNQSNNIGQSLTMFLLTLFTIQMAFAQKKTDSKQNGQNTIKITIDKNGKTEVFEENFTGNIPENVKKKLKEANIEMDAILSDLDDKKLKMQDKIEDMQDKISKKAPQIDVFIHKNGKKLPGKTFEEEDMAKLFEEKFKNFEKNFDFKFEWDEEDKDNKKEIKIYRRKGNDIDVIEAPDVMRKNFDFKFDLDEADFDKAFQNFNQKLAEAFKKIETIDLGNGHQLKLFSEIPEIPDPAIQPQLPTLDDKIDLNNKNLILTGFSFYPTNQAGTFKLSFNAKETGDLDITLIDFLGNTIYQALKQDFEGQYEDEVSLDVQKKGIYVFKIKLNGKFFTQTLVID
jgi:hypothetical protein